MAPREINTRFTQPDEVRDARYENPAVFVRHDVADTVVPVVTETNVPALRDLIVEVVRETIIPEERQNNAPGAWARRHNTNALLARQREERAIARRARPRRPRITRGQQTVPLRRPNIPIMVLELTPPEPRNQPNPGEEPYDPASPTITPETSDEEEYR